MMTTHRIDYNVPLRRDFVAGLILPHDLTTTEANRLCDMIAALVISPPPSLVAQHVDDEPGGEADPGDEQEKE